MLWEGTENKVFGDGGVKIVPEIPIQNLPAFPSPCAFIVDSGGACDRDHPGLIRQAFNLTIFVENVQHEYGEGAIIGGCRVANTSSGAGVLDIEEEILPQIIETTELTTKVMLVEKSMPRVSAMKSNFPLVTRAMTFTVLLSVY